MFNNGPPEFPGLMPALIWIKSIIVLGVVDRNIPMQRADDPLRTGVDIAVGIADCDHGFAFHEVGCWYLLRNRIQWPALVATFTRAKVIAWT